MGTGRRHEDHPAVDDPADADGSLTACRPRPHQIRSSRAIAPIRDHVAPLDSICDLSASLERTAGFARRLHCGPCKRLVSDHIEEPGGEIAGTQVSLPNVLWDGVDECHELSEVPRAADALPVFVLK
jgi:hypothetical protein